MKRAWLIRFVAAGAGLATVSLCVRLPYPASDASPGMATPSPQVFAAPTPSIRGADILHANRRHEAADAPGPAWKVAREGKMLRIELLSPHLEVTACPAGKVLHFAGQSGPVPGGAPDVPVLARVDPGQPGMKARVKVAASEYVDIQGVDVAPEETRRRVLVPDGEPDMRTSRDPDPAIYGADAFWPPALADVEEAWMGTQKLVRTELHPVQYNPVTRTVRFYETLSAQVVFEPIEPAITADAHASTTEAVLTDPFDCPPLYGDPVLPAMNGNAQDFALRRAGGEVDAIFKIRVREEGIYKVTRAELLAAGLASSDLVGGSLRLFGRDREVALHTSTSGAMGEDDYFLFFGEGYDGRYTDENVYWLGLGGSGLRMSPSAAAPLGAAPTVDWHYATVAYAPNVGFADSISPLDEEWDHWWAKQLYTGANSSQQIGLTQDVLVDHPVPGMDARVCISVHAGPRAGENPLHTTAVSVEGTTVAAFSWNGRPEFQGAPFRGSEVFSSSQLSDGMNTLFVRQQTTYDLVYFESVALVYPRTLLGIGDALRFTGTTGQNNYDVDGFTANTGLWLFDISDSPVPVLLTDFETSSTANGYQVRFGRETPTRPAFFVTHDRGFKQALSIEKTMIRGLGDVDQQADYIAICPYAYRDQVYQLITNRYVRGQTVVVAPIEDIFNEFSYGIEDASAIRQFLGYTFHHWQGPPPQCVVLVGDATYDPRGYRGGFANEVIPVHFGGTAFNYAALDTWFTLVMGDDYLVDMTIGRLPVSTVTNLQGVVDKILAYEREPASAPFRRRGLIVQDQNDPPTSFNVPAVQVYNIMSTNGFTDINRQIAGQGASTTKILNAINSADGRYAAAYFGHGSHFEWDNPALLETDDVSALVNPYLPIVTATTCINGYFVNAEGAPDGLAEALLKRNQYGAIATLAGTAATQPSVAHVVAVAFFDSAINARRTRLDEAMYDAILEGYAYFSAGEELLFYQIIGDPGLIINP